MRPLHFVQCDKYKSLEDELEAPPQRVDELLRNEGSFTSRPHGWYFVINYAESPAQGAGFKSRIAAYRDFEIRFFNNTAPYNIPEYRNRCGTENLLNKLTKYVPKESPILPKPVPNSDPSRLF